jgi:type IV secretion system protein VirB10
MSNKKDPDHDVDPGAPHPANEAASRPDDRDTLVKKRRARQAGASRRRSDTRFLMAAAVLVGGVGMLFVVIAPHAASSILGIGKNQDQKASQVSLKVDNQKDPQTHLDFVVPDKLDPTPANDSDTDLKKKVKALQDQLAKAQGGVSQAQLQQMLAKYNDSLNQKFDEERQAMAAENAKLRDADRQDAERQKQQLADLQKRQQLDQAQRESKMVVVDDGVAQGAATAAVAGSPDGLNANQRFLKSEASDVFQTAVSRKLTDPSSTVVQGTIISAVLETAIDTQLPGSVRAQVMLPVYSFDGTRVLMPPGTLLIGAFNNDVDIAQKRVLIAWNRAITPDGDSIALGSIGTDTLGRSGTLGNVDNRYMTKFGAATLISAITAAPALLAAQVGNGGTSGTTINVGGGGQFGASMGQGVSQQSSKMLEKYLSLPPVIRIPQGEEIRVFTNRDLIFR